MFTKAKYFKEVVVTIFLFLLLMMIIAEKNIFDIIYFVALIIFIIRYKLS